MIYLDSIIYSSGRLEANELKKAQILYLVLPISTIDKNNFCKIKILDKFLKENYSMAKMPQKTEICFILINQLL